MHPSCPISESGLRRCQGKRAPRRGIPIGAGKSPNGGIGGNEFCNRANLREWEDFQEISLGKVEASGYGPRSEPLPNPMSSRRCSLSARRLTLVDHQTI